MDAANKTALIRFAILVAGAVLISLAAPGPPAAVHLAGLLNVMFLVSLVFAAIKRQPPTGRRLTHIDEAAAFLALSLLVHVLAGDALQPAAPSGEAPGGP